MKQPSLRYVSAAELVVHDRNIRDELGDLTELASSIKELGILQPLLVRPRLTDDKLEIVAGHRRYNAALTVGHDLFPVIVQERDDNDVLEVMIVENTQRRTLNPIEVGRALKKLTSKGLTQTEIAKRIGKSPDYVSNCIAALELPKALQRRISRREVGLSTALRPYRNEYRARVKVHYIVCTGCEFAGHRMTGALGPCTKCGSPLRHRLGPEEQGGGLAEAPAQRQVDLSGVTKLLDDLHEVCQRRRVPFASARDLVGSMVAGLSPREAALMVMRLIEGKPDRLEAA